jgi:hypothetical protein
VGTRWSPRVGKVHFTDMIYVQVGLALHVLKPEGKVIYVLERPGAFQ